MKTLNELIQKYNKPGPRYTSFPPLPSWRNAPSEMQWLGHIKKNYNEDVGVDLYVHVPFCESLCFYCGCNRTITKNHGVEGPYLHSLLKEWEIYKKKLGFTPKINSLHFGGGTPTFLSPENLKTLITSLLENKSQTFIGSIEIDPRTCLEEHILVLDECDIKRVSLGIQDFDPSVQKAINRDQSPQMVESLVNSLRSHSFSSINFDLIYGLPNQTIKSITETIEIVSRLKPDLIAFYSYAHLPERIKNQRLIKNSELPLPQLKRELYEHGKKLLIENGYYDVGMDHFALPSSFLYKAMKEKQLHRNFMGYVDKKSPVLIGLGPTSISDSSMSFIQNVKDIKTYQERIEAGKLPIEIGHTHNQDDLTLQNIILQLMCHDEIQLSQTENLPFWNEIEKDLIVFKEDGLIEMESGCVRITPVGKGFVRNIAMSFDNYLRETSLNTKFSQTI